MDGEVTFFISKFQSVRSKCLLHSVIMMHTGKSEERFYSDEIACMLIVGSCNETHGGNNFTRSDGTVDWDIVEKFFANDLVPHDKPLTYEHCSLLTPKFHVFLKQCPTVQFQTEKLKWTNRSDMIALSQQASNLTAAMILSSVLEYSLGNLFLTRTGSTPPHLLRDLLMTDALATELGETVIYLLRLLLGSPNGTNLRNLVWHGFLSNEDLSPIYNNFLLLIMTSVGNILDKRNCSMKHRSCSLDAQLLLAKIEAESFSEVQFRTCLANDRLVTELQRRDWMDTLDYYNQKQYFFCVSRALTQLEMYLRRLYGELYGRDPRAKLDEYYIIMDTVFEELNSTTGKRNRIYNHFSASLLELVYDLFSAMYGPRIRDKLSHGELQIDQIDETLAKAVLFTCYLVITNNAQFTYESVYHPNAILQAKLMECKAAIHQIQTLQFPKFIDDSESIGYVPFIPQVDIIEHAKIFYRPDGEDVLIGYLQRIAVALELAAKNLHQSLTLKLEAVEKRELRSRARNTFNNMLKMLPTIRKAFEHVLRVLVWIFYCLMKANEIRDLDKLIRFMKFILKYTENAANNLDAKNNVWLPLYETSRRELYDKTRQNLKLLLY